MPLRLPIRPSYQFSSTRRVNTTSSPVTVKNMSAYYNYLQPVCHILLQEKVSSSCQHIQSFTVGVPGFTALNGHKFGSYFSELLVRNVTTNILHYFTTYISSEYAPVIRKCTGNFRL